MRSVFIMAVSMCVRVRVRVLHSYVQPGIYTAIVYKINDGYLHQFCDFEFSFIDKHSFY